MIEPLIASCESKDLAKKSEIEISEFCNILRFNIPNISQDLLINFQHEFKLENDNSVILNYVQFFDKYASKEEVINITSKGYDPMLAALNEIVDINSLIKKIVVALNNSTVNVSYALKFI